MEDSRKVMIRLNGIGKVYRLGQIGNGTLQSDLQSWWAKVRGREDPNAMIGQVRRLEGDRFIALENIDLTVRKGERLGIIGGNGARKSTLLKIITRITAPTTGHMDLYGKVTSMLEVGTGFHSEMTGRENVYLNGSILGMTKKQTDEMLDEIIEFSEVRDFIDTPVKRYSSGMYVKLAFAVAAHLKSDIVIMDEVLAVGDLAFQSKCIRKMLDASRDEDRTILYVSHNMETVRRLCSRCIVLDEGRLVYDGETEEAIRYYSEYLMKQAMEERDASTYVRRDRNITGLCRIEDVYAHETDVPQDGTLSFDVSVQCACSVERMILRLVVSNDAGMIVGMTFSESIRCEEGRNDLRFRFPVHPLAAGRYVCDLVLCEFEEDRQTRHDFVSKILAFTVTENRTYFGNAWKFRSWGNVKLEEVSAERKAHE